MNAFLAGLARIVHAPERFTPAQREALVNLATAQAIHGDAAEAVAAGAVLIAMASHQ